MNNNKKYRLYWSIWYFLFGVLLILMFNLELPYKTWIMGLLVIMALFEIMMLIYKFYK
ncbi:hypothetical protein MFS40622_1378 [Methanocaldococcus sp. FS406-22]|uniref:hypothetical protein n=1 Tax=Methanocaldococcus sp. (strain FS406-22) TaxID=644281 RepID=UPI0001BF47FD|nr:hypothetical protein [Methanocaldococcus sp. FS406-22]ADC70054.1 hypothetical protein MFS40622_1378 [Methanocaldococcus sp. FS406-22]